jgi:ankyrin repeat protein
LGYNAKLRRQKIRG